MKVKIVGIQSQDYKLENGYEFKGVKLHCIDEETSQDGLNGFMVMNIKIADDSKLSDVPLTIGGKYIAYFNQKGALDYLVESNK